MPTAAFWRSKTTSKQTCPSAAARHGNSPRRTSRKRAPSSCGPRPSSITSSRYPTAKTARRRSSPRWSRSSRYENLRGVLPKGDYQELDNDVLGQLLRTLNPDELKRVSGDVFGRIYEYFLTQFADQKAHDDGEFFTPISIVSLIAHVLDPERGTVLDPACGSGGMFVQSARIVEEHGGRPSEKLTFRGLEKNGTTIRLAKMNLAVHGLEGDIKKAITYYDDPHKLVGKVDYVMANPPFNVDEIDADKVK